MLYFGTTQTSRGSKFVYSSKLEGCDDAATTSVCSDFGTAVTVGRAWNLVPAEIRQSRTLGSFKRQKKSFLLKVSYKKFLTVKFFSGRGVVVLLALDPR